MDVKIVDVEPILVAALEHRGAPALLNDSVQRFIAWRKSSGLSPVSQCETYGVPYNDPNTTPPEEFRFDICGSVTAPAPANNQGVVTKTIPGGRCAMTIHAGSRDRIDESVYALYRDWLPEIGRGTAGFPGLFPLSEPRSRYAGASPSDRDLSAAEIRSGGGAAWFGGSARLTRSSARPCSPKRSRAAA